MNPKVWDRVWFMPDDGDPAAEGKYHEASIVGVISETVIDVCAINSLGNAYLRDRVPLYEKGGPATGPYATYEKAAPVPPEPAETRLTVYEHDNFVGSALTMTSALANFAPMDFNDKASSAIVEGGRWEVFEHANFGGRKVVLEVGNHPSLRQFNFNDAISSARPVTPPVVVPIPPGKRYFGYFYSDDAQVQETADHVNLLHIPQQGQACVDRMALAKAAGTMNVILTMDRCGFDWNGNRNIYVGDTESRRRIREFMQLIADGGLMGMVVAQYTVDEPNGPNFTDAADLAAFCTDLRIVDAEFETLPALATCYGVSNDYRAVGAHDWLGPSNAYGQGAGALVGPYNDLVANLRDDQRTIIYPACAGPWRQEPWPWKEKFDNDPRVVWLMPFDWVGYDGKPNGLRQNPSLQPADVAVGQAIKSA